MSPEHVLRHYDNASFWSEPTGLDLDGAYRLALAVRQLRLARGEKPRGFKIGYTNRGTWARLGVSAPMWGTVYDTTLTLCEGRTELSLAGFWQPRIEPECVFGLAATPPPEPTLDQLLACLDWIAPGFEIVQSHLPREKLTAFDTIADGGVHAHLVVGQRMPAAALGPRAEDFEQALAAAGVVLRQDGRRMAEGNARIVMDGPLQALQHFVRVLRACPGAPDLQPGDVITTGTWTDALPIAPGETWAAEFGAPLSPLEVHFR